ncbi:MFS transporter [Longirhabdus pacifica]|uniref:MFS transporter n=1 Tax=Longirhabdus pacifica TaxID=2305227 RepID=UPI001008F4E1|nr:MFS transporter [Longirhabdus pacifica]
MNKRTFFILVSIIFITGLNQGLLIPLLTILLEKQGLSSTLNGFHTAGLYIGIIGTMFFVERWVLRHGYKKMIMIGTLIVMVASILFPLWDALAFWFVLRMLIGVGDSILHYTVQLWIVSTSSAATRGRTISLYGMAYGVGFSVGPLGINLLALNQWIAFVLLSVLFGAAFIVVRGLSNEFPQTEREADMSTKPKNKYAYLYRLAWFPLIPALLYGYMEASMNGIFPIYGINVLGFEAPAVSLLLFAIGAGGLIFQYPLGMLSDKISRKKVLMGLALVGGTAFLLVPFVPSSFGVIFILFIIAGGCVGSFFSLGLAYAADILPKSALPTANVVASLLFSAGSLMGPTLTGFSMEFVSKHSLFYGFAGFYLTFFLLGFLFQRSQKKVAYQQMDTLNEA